MRHENVIDRGFDDVAQPVNLPEAAAYAGPQRGRFEADLGAGVEDGAILVGGGGGVAMGIAVMGETTAHPRRNIEPAE